MVKIIIVDDHELFRTGIKQVLETTGNYEIIGEVSNGKELLEMLKYVKPEVILMDINMPEMNGYEATKIIKAEKPSIPVIAQTAYSISGDKERTIESGCDDYISKPIKKQELFRLIQKYI